MAVTRKLDQRRDDLCVGGLRKRELNAQGLVSNDGFIYRFNDFLNIFLVSRV
jgi:hypothetical protein